MCTIFRPSSAHYHLLSDVLNIARDECDAYVALTPSDTTWALQLVDDNRGKSFRGEIDDLTDEFLLEFDFEKNPRGTMPATQKRILMANFVNQVARKWQNSEVERTNTIGAATRTGLRMETARNFEKIVPVRFARSF